MDINEMVETETRPSLLLCLLLISYTSLSLARRALQDVYPLIPGFLSDEHATACLGTILNFQTAGYTLTKLISGVLIDRINPSGSLIATLACTAATLFLMSVSSSTLFWLILCTMNGLVLGMSWPSVAKILRTSVPSRELATWWGVISASVNLAGVVGPWISLSLFTILSMYFGEERAWKLVLVTTGCGCVFSVVLFLLHFRFQRERNGKKMMSNNTPLKSGFTLSNGPIHELGDPQASMDKGATKTGIHTKAAHTDDNLQPELHSTTRGSSKPGLTQQWCKLYQSLSPTQRMLLCCSAIVHLASTFLRFAISNWFPIMLLKQKEEFGYGRGSINSLISSYELGGILGNLSAGMLSDIGVLRNRLWLNPRIPFILTHMCLGSVVLILVSFSISRGSVGMWSLMFMMFTLGLTVFGTVSLCGVLAVELAPPSLSGTSHALTALAANVGMRSALNTVRHMDLTAENSNRHLPMLE